jgi:ribosomal protein L31
MSLKNNIQGTKDTRLEDANSPDAILRAAAMENNPNPALHGKAELLTKNKITDTVIQIELEGGQTGPFTFSPDTRIINNSEYGDVLIPYEFLRFFYTSPGKDWIDMKVTKFIQGLATSGGKGAPVTWKFWFEGILLNGGKFEDIILNEDVRWSFYAQIPEDNREPIDLYVGDITSSTATFSWEDSTKNMALYHQIKYRKWDGDEGPWIFSDIGGWVDGVENRLEGARWPSPTETYLGKEVYWMEFSKPDVTSGTKAEGWIEIVEGNFGESFITNIGSGYRFTPSIELYFRELSLNTLDSKDPSQSFTITKNGSDLDINSNAHPFQTNDNVIITFTERSFEKLNGTYSVSVIDPNNFKILNVSNVITLSAVTLSPSGKIELAPIERPVVPGEIIPIINKNKYYITGLDTNSNYSVTVMSYFNDGSDFSNYANEISFSTR